MSRFPPPPAALRGRATELRVLTTVVRAQHPTALALVGGGGSGKSTLAAALGHRLRGMFRGRIHWVRIGAWDRTTVLQMLALQLGLWPVADPVAALRGALGAARAFVVLDNHEDDAATADTLETLRGLPVTWVITARRCLLGGVTLFPVVPPLIEQQRSPFPAVASLTRLLRWHPVALALADGLVTAGRVTPEELAVQLRDFGVERITPLEHEDDVPEVRAVVRCALATLAPAAVRMLAVLAHARGDDTDAVSLAQLARAGRHAPAALAELRALRLVQEPHAGHLALHATVRHALARALPFDEDAIARHYLRLLERHPGRFATEQTQLFALMDWAQNTRDVGTILRVNALTTRLERVITPKGD